MRRTRRAVQPITTTGTPSPFHPNPPRRPPSPSAPSCAPSSPPQLKADLIRMIENCKTYNGQRTVFYKEAERLGAYVEKLFQNLSVAGGTSGMAR